MYIFKGKKVREYFTIIHLFVYTHEYASQSFKEKYIFIRYNVIITTSPHSLSMYGIVVKHLVYI